MATMDSLWSAAGVSLQGSERRSARTVAFGQSIDISICTVPYWTGLDRTVLDCTGPYWTGLYCTGLYCTGLDWTGLDWTGLSGAENSRARLEGFGASRSRRPQRGSARY